MITWTSGRFRNERAAMPSSAPSTTRMRPSAPMAARAALASLVLGASKLQLSTTRTLPSAARSDRAERRARRTIFLGVFWTYLRGFGPRATPPPRQIGERLEPARARPVPFWRHGLAPPPRASERVLVDWVPARRAASWAVTTWAITDTLGSRPKTASSSSTEPAFLPAGLRRSALLTWHHPSRRCG